MIFFSVVFKWLPKLSDLSESINFLLKKVLKSVKNRFFLVKKCEIQVIISICSLVLRRGFSIPCAVLVIKIVPALSLLRYCVEMCESTRIGMKSLNVLFSYKIIFPVCSQAGKITLIRRITVRKIGDSRPNWDPIEGPLEIAWFITAPSYCGVWGVLCWAPAMPREASFWDSRCEFVQSKGSS